MKNILLYIMLCFIISPAFGQSEDTKALILKGDSFFEAGQFEKANTYYSSIIANSKSNNSFIIDIYYKRAYGNLFLNKHAQSISDLNRIVSINPEIAKVYFLRSKMQLLPKLKVKDLEKAYELDPTNQNYIETLALTKISIVAHKFDEIRNQNKSINKEQLMQELFFASGGCELLKTLNKTEAELKSILQKYCSQKEVKNF